MFNNYLMPGGKKRCVKTLQQVTSRNKSLQSMKLDEDFSRCYATLCKGLWKLKADIQLCVFIEKESVDRHL